MIHMQMFCVVFLSETQTELVSESWFLLYLVYFF